MKKFDLYLLVSDLLLICLLTIELFFELSLTLRILGYGTAFILLIMQTFFSKKYQRGSSWFETSLYLLLSFSVCYSLSFYDLLYTILSAVTLLLLSFF